MLIRHATLEDATILSEVENLCFPIQEAASKEIIIQRLLHYNQHFWLLFEGDKLISFVDGMVSDAQDLSDEMYENANMHNPNGKWQMIFGVNTIPSHRRLGYAALLIHKTIKDAKNQNRKGLVLTCKEHMIPYYSKFGFVNEGLSKSVHGDVIWYQMRLTF